MPPFAEAGYPRPVTTPTRAPRTRRAAATASPDPAATDGTDVAPRRRAAAPAPGADPDGGIGEVHELLKAAVDETARLLDADGAMVYLIDPATGHLRFAHDAGIRSRRTRNWVRSIDLPVGVGMFGRAVAERAVVMTSDYMDDAAFPHAPETDRVVRRHRHPLDGRRPAGLGRDGLRSARRVLLARPTPSARRRSAWSGRWPTTPPPR